MPNDRKTSGFAAIEVLLVVLVLMVLGVVGYFTFNHSGKTKATVVNKPTAANEPTVSNEATAPPAGWLAYKSTHSSLQFFYPNAWQLKQLPLEGKPNYYLEDVSLTGPNNFALTFTLEKTHVRPNQVWSCPALPKQTDVAINAKYKMVLTDRGGVSLLAVDYRGTVPDDQACGSLINLLTPDSLFKFSGGYTTSASSVQSLETLVNQPEVQTVKAIFSSLKQ